MANGADFLLVRWLEVDYLGSEARTLSVTYGPVPELNHRLEGQKSNYPAKGTLIFCLASQQKLILTPTILHALWPLYAVVAAADKAMLL